MANKSTQRTDYHPPTIKWFLETIQGLFVSIFPNPETAAENINFTSRCLKKVYDKVVVKKKSTHRGCSSNKIGYLIYGHGAKIHLRKKGCVDKYWEWEWSIYDPYDIRILELCHQCWFDHHQIVPATVPFVEIPLSPDLCDSKNDQIFVTRKKWNATYASNQVRMQQGLKPLLPQPIRPIATIAQILRLLEDLDLEMCIEYPVEYQHVPKLPVSDASVSPQTPVIVGTVHHLEQLNTIGKYPYFYPIRFDNKKKQSLVAGLAKDPAHLLIYDKSNRSRNKAQTRLFLFEVKLLPQLFSADELRVRYGHRSQSQTTDYRVLRIQAISTAFDFSNVSDIFNLVHNSDEVQVFTFADLVHAHLGQYHQNPRSEAAQE